MNTPPQHTPSPNAISRLDWLKTDVAFLSKNGFTNKISEEWKQHALERFGVEVNDEPDRRFVGVYYAFSKVNCTDGRYSQTLSSFLSDAFSLIQQVSSRYGSILGDEENSNGSHILIQDRNLNTWALWGFIPGVAFLRNENEDMS